MASEAFIDSMDHWTDVVVDHLYDFDPVFACEAVHELDNINHQFPNALKTPSAPATPQTTPFFPGFNTPASRSPSGPAPIFRTPQQVPHNAWTPMHTGGATPNSGIRGDPNTPLPPRCQCGRRGECRCGHGTPQRRKSSFSSPFRRTPHQSPFARSTPLPQPPAQAAPQGSQPPQHPNSNSPSRTMPTLPHEPPSLQQWTFPAGELRWSPHPAPHPQIPNTPVNASQAAQLTGGWPLPGAAPWWTPNVWPQNVRELTSSPVQLAPCLVPNPADADAPQFLWDVAHSPHVARALTSRATVNLQALFSTMATNPPVDTIHIAIHDGLAQRLWGSIIIQNRNNVSVWDVLYGIYAYFQTPITRQDLAYLETIDQSHHTALLDAARKRGAATIEEVKRLDSLGDQRRFWGLWITNMGQEGWYLNLGLNEP